MLPPWYGWLIGLAVCLAGGLATSRVLSRLSRRTGTSPQPKAPQAAPATPADAAAAREPAQLEPLDD